MSGFVSKFRHVYGEPAKQKGQYSDVKNPMCSGESQYVKANARCFAVGKASGGAPLYVKSLSDVGRFKPGTPCIATHRGRLTDFDFHPFIDTIIATCADDCKVNINKFPADGLTEDVKEAEIEIKGHRKKVSLVTFSPSASNIIASASYDRTVKVFNIENAACVSSFDEFGDNVYSVAWNKDGSQLATTSKDKVLRMFDPRKADAAIKIDGAFGGIKATKVFYVDSFNWVGSTGFSKSAKREIKLWDCRNTEKPLFKLSLDAQASVLMPHVDNDLGILYLTGKGDNSVQYYEFRNDDKMLHYLSAYRDGVPQKGGGWVPKRGMQVMKCEVQRFLKLTKDSVIPVSFIVPRKSGSEVFQEDIYPNCQSNKPAMSADDWIGGATADPNTMSMNPEDRGDESGGGVEFKKKKTYDQVVQENMELLKKVKQLEEEIAELKGVPPPEEDESKEE